MVYNGADDDASGVATVMEAARAWIVNGRLTDAGKSALKTMEAGNIILHLVSPSDELLSNALQAAEKPFIVTGTYSMATAP